MKEETTLKINKEGKTRKPKNSQKFQAFNGEILDEILYLKRRLLRYKKYLNYSHSEMIFILDISRASYYKILNCDESLNIVIYLKVLAHINDGLLKNIHHNEFLFDKKTFEDFNKKVGFFDLDVMKGYYWLSEQIRIVKKERKMTYDYISQFTGVSKNVIKGFIQKKSIIRARDVFVLMNFLNIKFYTGNGNSFSHKQVDSAIVNIPLVRIDEEGEY